MFFLNISSAGKKKWDGSLPFKRGVQVLAALLVLFSGMAVAQFTTVTGTVTDPDNVPYSNGTISAKLVTSASPTLNGLAYTPPTQPSGLDINGKFTLNVADNTQLSPAGTKWNFTVCSAIGTVNPAFGTASQCFSLAAPITISGSSQDISTNLNAVAPRLTQPFGTGSGTVTGTGTVNTIAEWTGASSIGNSDWTDTSTTTSGYGGEFQFFPSTLGKSQLLLGKTSGGNKGYLQLFGGTSNNYFNIQPGNAAASRADFGGSAASGNGCLQWMMDATAALVAGGVNYLTWSPGAGGTPISCGFKFQGAGDAQGTGTASGFSVQNTTSTLASSPGASNFWAAGNATGTTNGAAPGGDNTFTSGNAGGGNNRGGDFTITAGNGNGTGRGGNIILTPGTGSPNGTVSTGSAATFTGPQPQITLGSAGGNSGQLALAGSTSGTATFTAPAVAGTNSNAVISSNALQVGTVGTTGGILSLAGSTSGTATFTAPAVAGTTTNAVVSSNVISAPNIPSTYNAAGTLQTGVHVVQDTCTLGTNCAVTLSGSAAFTSSTSYHCTATDATAANAVRANQTSGSAVTFTGTGTDVINFICIGT